MLYQIKDGTVSAGGQTILSHVDFYIKEKEKIAVVGKNGAGKTTLLRLLAGELTPDRDDSRGSYGRSNDMVTGAATAGSDLDGTAKRTQRAKKKKPSGNPETGITMSRNITIDMLRQADKSNQDLTIEQILLESCPDKDTFSKERFDYEMEYDRLFTGFGFEKSDKTRLFRSFSGGEQTKISLIKLLLKKPDLLLLDEPTNHLDKRSREKLYDFITSCRITLLVVSHDRTLLNLLASIAELSVGGITLYGGNYDFYKEQKEQEQASMQEKLEAKEKELRRVRKTAREVAERKQKHESRGEKQSVRKGIPRIMMGGLKENAEKSASKLKEVHEDKMENLANELKQMRSSLPDLQGMKLDFSASGLHEGKILVTAKEINFGYAEAGDLWPSPMSFQIKSGERWLIQGDNGSGKTTLLKLITGQLPPRSGSLIRADFSSIYIDQEYSIVRNDRTVYEQAQAFNERHFQEHEIKTLLNRFLFPHDTWEKSCGKLSGGEKMRLAFCCLMISNQTPDLFILDEPTNNLDIQSIEIITSMVRAYRGTILLISHDAYFIRELGIHQIITTFAGRLKTNL